MRESRPLDPLLLANMAFVIAVLLHAGDHLRQGLDRLTPEVFWGGLLLAIIGLGTLPVTLWQHPRAPLIAAVVGLFTALAVASSHLAPYWSVFSDPYSRLSVDAFSWAVMLAEILTAVSFGLLGLHYMRRRSQLLQS